MAGLEDARAWQAIEPAEQSLDPPSSATNAELDVDEVVAVDVDAGAPFRASSRRAWAGIMPERLRLTATGCGSGITISTGAIASVGGREVEGEGDRCHSVSA